MYLLFKIDYDLYVDILGNMIVFFLCCISLLKGKGFFNRSFMGI